MLTRLLERGLTADAARHRLDAQWPTERKAARADFVITTDGTFEETDRQVQRDLLQIVAAGAIDAQHSIRIGAVPARRHRDVAASGEILSRQ